MSFRGLCMGGLLTALSEYGRGEISGGMTREVIGMASSKAYLAFILEQLSEAGEVTHRAMMGSFLLYYRGRLFGGIYDDRLLVKPVEAARAYMPEAELEVPYSGAKPMLLVDNVDNRAYLAGLLRAMYDELPEPGEKRKKAR